MTRTTTLIAVALSAICFACGDEGDEHGDDSHDSLTVTLAPKSDNTTLAGTAVFSGEPGKIQIKLDLTGAPPGDHGVHLHETGDCSAPDAMSAGGHWNPSMMNHGKLGTAPHHGGDIGNITVGADGKGSLMATNPDWELGTGTANDVTGKAVIVHAKADDFMTQPTGDAGGRIGCGVIK